MKNIQKDDAYHTLNFINSWINNVDARTSFCISICNGVIIGFVLFVNGSPSVFANIQNTRKISCMLIKSNCLEYFIWDKLLINHIYVFGNQSQNKQYQVSVQ